MHDSCFCIRLCRFANNIVLVCMHSTFCGEASWSERSHRMNSWRWLDTWTAIQYLFASALCDGAWRTEAIAASVFCYGAFLETVKRQARVWHLHRISKYIAEVFTCNFTAECGMYTMKLFNVFIICALLRSSFLRDVWCHLRGISVSF